MNLFQAESATETMEVFFATIVNVAPNIDANWIASHPAGLREPKNPSQIGITDPNATSNQLSVPLPLVLMGAKFV